MAGSLGIELTEDAKKLVEDHIEGGENGNKSTNPTVVTGANENKNENRKEVGSMAGPTGYIKNDYGTFEESTGIFTFNEDVKEIDKDKVNKIVKSLNESGVDKFGVTGNSVQKIGDMAFYGCSSLTTAEFNAATTIGSSAFRYCTALTTAEFNAVTTIGLGAFDSCSSLEKAEFKVAKTIGNYAFYNCSSLTKAEFPKAVSIGERAFEGCKALKEENVKIPNMETIDESAFYGCPILEELKKKVDEDVPPPLPPEMSEKEMTAINSINSKIKELHQKIGQVLPQENKETKTISDTINTYEQSIGRSGSISDICKMLKREMETISGNKSLSGNLRESISKIAKNISENNWNDVLDKGISKLDKLPNELSQPETEEKDKKFQWQDNVAYKANGSNFVPLTPLSNAETTIVFPEDQVKKFNNQVDEFNKLVGEIETFKSANKDKIKQVIGDTNLGWTEYSNTAWVNDKKSDFTSNTNNYTDMVGRTDPKNSKLNQFYEVMLNYLSYQNKEKDKNDYINLDPERKLGYIDVVIDNIKKTFESLKEEVKNLSTGQDENKKNETLASQTDGGMKPPNFPAPTHSEYEKMNELKGKLKNLNDKYNGLVKDNGAFFDRYLSKDTKDSSGVQKSYDIVQSASEVKGFLGAFRTYISNISIPLREARTDKFVKDAEAITDSKVDENEKMTQMYELAKEIVEELKKAAEEYKSPEEVMKELKGKFGTLTDKIKKIYGDNRQYTNAWESKYNEINKYNNLVDFNEAETAYCSSIIIKLDDKAQKKYYDKCNQIYLNCRTAKDYKTKSDCLTQMYELAARAVYRLEKNIAKQEKRKREAEDLKSKDTLGKAIYKAKKVGRKAGKKLDKFLGTDHVFHSKKNKDEGGGSAKQAKLVKKCFKNAANYIVKFKLGSFKRKELNKAFNGLTGNEFISWKNELKQYFESTTQIDKFALAEDKKKDYKKASVAVVLASLCGLPNTECIISACEGLKEGGLRGNFKGRDYLNDAVKIRKDVKTKAIAGDKESVKAYLSSNAKGKLESLIKDYAQFKNVVGAFSGIKQNTNTKQEGNEEQDFSKDLQNMFEEKKGLKDKISGGVKTVKGVVSSAGKAIGGAASAAGKAIGGVASFAAGKAKDLFKKSPKGAGNIDNITLGYGESYSDSSIDEDDFESDL